MTARISQKRFEMLETTLLHDVHASQPNATLLQSATASTGHSR